MADKRINALANTAPSTASDDFIAVDGTTNGTRKLNAFSPTFGGNATVTGTLTVNGSGTYGSINMPSATTLGAGLAFGTDITIYRNFANQLSTTAYALTGGVSGAGYFSIIASGSSVLTFNNGNGESFRVGASRGVNIGDTADVAAGSLKVSGTTASTTTSSGALVVGNGTSGGLGVGGSVNINNNLTLGYASAGDSVLKIIRSSGGNEWLQIAGWSAGSLGNNAYSIDAVNGASARPVYFRRSTDAGSTYTNFLTWDTSNNATFDGRITSSTNTDSGVLQLNLVNSSTGTSASSLFRFNAGTRTATLQAYNDTHATLAGQLRVGTSNGDIVVIPSGVTATTFGSSTVTVNHSTASTSTSSGALVVSGGVGVAGAVNAGGSIVSNPLHTVARKIEAQIAHSVSTEDYVRVSSNSGTTNTYGGEFGYGLTAGGSPQIKFNRVHAGTVTTWLTVPTSTGDAEFAGSVKTAAPSGGTAAAWKLGTVASVSPTSPNRTIEVDIGGTIYYIHAKTTNN